MEYDVCKRKRDGVTIWMIIVYEWDGSEYVDKDTIGPFNTAEEAKVKIKELHDKCTD